MNGIKSNGVKSYMKPIKNIKTQAEEEARISLHARTIAKKASMQTISVSSSNQKLTSSVGKNVFERLNTGKKAAQEKQLKVEPVGPLFSRIVYGTVGK